MAGRDGGKAIETGVIARVIAGVRFMITGNAPEDFFGPGQPMAPVAQDAAAGRQFDYPFATNTASQPRSTEAIDFPTLRALADSYDLVRLAIETRKDQMGKLRWTVQRRDTGKQDAKAKEIEAFLQEPDREHDFLTWKRMLLEDLLVIDAPTVYVRRTKGGQPFSFDIVDGATIKRILNADGRTPLAPDPAYQQVLKGLPAVNYHRDELLYKPRNPRPNRVYGFSPVEQIVLIINIAIRRQTSQLQYYTEGNIPDAFGSLPASWSAEQIEKFQKYWDLLLTGDTAAKRRVRWLPGDGKVQPVRAEPLFDHYDEWIARVVSFAFSLPPTAFVKQNNRATAESAQDIALEEGLSPLMEWQVRFMNRMIRLGWNTTDYEFSWLKETALDPMEQAKIDEIYLKNHVRRVNEIRADLGWEPDNELEALAMAPPPPPPGMGGDPEAAATDTAKQKAEDTAQAQAEKVALALEQLRAAIEKRDERTAPAAPTLSELAVAIAKMTDAGVPLNEALKKAGFDVTVPGGDVAMVSASRIPLSVAADPTALEPAPVPVQKVEKREPAPPAPIIVQPAVVPAPNVELNPTFHFHEAVKSGTRTVRYTKPDGVVVSGEITDVDEEKS